jgi:septum formation topological specificity factor MinE
MRDPRFDDIPFILETPMLSGSLQVTVKTPQSSKSTTTNGSGAIKTEVKVETDDIQLFDEEKADNDTPEGNLTIGATTWKREIQLLHALELVPVGETSEEIERLQAEIMAIVTQYRKKEEAIAQAKKTAKEAAKAEKEQQNERDGKGKKGKGRKKAKIEPKEEEEEEEEMGRQDSDEEACASHGENDE